ncbi:ABC transporter permease [Oceanicella sp. SM1341]|uniref:ABC transporter permease n=1 Tax=Oceanicella sp. SM1341 TaxID=1548889 RepID=UPI000E4AD2A1|nr:ABC transporter permease [Oceanicella sp. SM1341]
MLRLEARREPSRAMLLLTPVLAVALTVLFGGALFAALGKDPVAAMRVIFVDPLFDPYSRSELMVKGAPLALIAIGLSLGFRAGIWNIGAEGQFIMGAVAASAVALAFYDVQGLWLLPLMLVAGTAAGAGWAMIPAVLKTRFGANEILVSLMLVYVAEQFLIAMVSGPLRDPQGFNFPLSRSFHDSAVLPVLMEYTRVHVGVLVTLLVVIAAQVLMSRHIFGFRIRLSGEAPRAARFAGVDRAHVTWACMGLSGAAAGLAGMFEVAGPAQQLAPSLPVGYGFTAIIVAFLGRLSPPGIVLAAAIMALTYIGGETAQFALGIPAAANETFRGMLLFFLLGLDILVRYRLVPKRREART